MTDMLPRTGLPQRRKRALSQAQKDGDACLLCETDFQRLDARVPFGDSGGYRCVDAAACARIRAALYTQPKTSDNAHPSSPKGGHDVGENHSRPG